MTSNEKALLAEMQNLGYSHGMCVMALRLLSQSQVAISDMLAYIYEEQPAEMEFMQELAQICENYGLLNKP